MSPAESEAVAAELELYRRLHRALLEIDLICLPHWNCRSDRICDSCEVADSMAELKTLLSRDPDRQPPGSQR